MRVGEDYQASIPDLVSDSKFPCLRFMMISISCFKMRLSDSIKLLLSWVAIRRPGTNLSFFVC